MWLTSTNDFLIPAMNNNEFFLWPRSALNVAYKTVPQSQKSYHDNLAEENVLCVYARSVGPYVTQKTIRPIWIRFESCVVAAALQRVGGWAGNCEWRAQCERWDERWSSLMEVVVTSVSWLVASLFSVPVSSARLTMSDDSAYRPITSTHISHSRPTLLPQCRWIAHAV